jgi:hypothetical protein
LDGVVDLGSAEEHYVVHRRVDACGDVGPNLVSQAADDGQALQQVISNTNQPRCLHRRRRLPVLGGEALHAGVGMPQKIVGVDVVLEELGYERIKGGVLRRRVFYESFKCLEVQPMLSACVALGSRLKDATQDLAIPGCEDGLVLLVLVLGVILVDGVVDVLAESGHGLIVVVI